MLRFLKGKMRILRKFFAVAAALTCLVSAAPAYSAVSYISASAAQEAAASASAVQVFASSEEAAEYLRTQLVQRNPEVTLTLSSKEGLTGGELMNKIVDLAVAETGVSNEDGWPRRIYPLHGKFCHSGYNYRLLYHRRTGEVCVRQDSKHTLTSQTQ